MQEAEIAEATRYIYTMIHTSDYLKNVLGKHNLKVNVTVEPSDYEPERPYEAPATKAELRARELCRLMATRWELDTVEVQKHLGVIEGKTIQAQVAHRAMEKAIELDKNLSMTEGSKKKKILIHKSPENICTRLQDQVNPADQKCEQV